MFQTAPSVSTQLPSQSVGSSSNQHTAPKSVSSQLLQSAHSSLVNQQPAPPVSTQFLSQSAASSSSQHTAP